MSGFACSYCGRKFAERVRRPPDCPTQDSCDIQREAETEPLDPISELLGTPELAALPAVAPASASAPVPPNGAPPPTPAARPEESFELAAGSLIGGFVIGAKEAGSGDDTYYDGTHRVSAERVRIRRYRAIGAQQPGFRADVRKLIDAHGHPSFLRLLHLEQAGGFSFEVLERPRGPSLRERAAGRPMASADLRAIIRQLAGLIGQLHAPKFGRSLVHGGLSPDTVFARRTDDGGTVLEVGGWESAMVVMANSEVTCALPPLDLRTCPPEVVGKVTYGYDEHTKAWDWWALGRIVQELILGQHVFALLPAEGVEALHLRQSIMLDEDTTRFSPKGLRYRPGLVEIMGARVAAEERTLLRGLLACNPRARWGASAVEAWLRGAAPDDAYDLSAVEPIFAWDGMTFSVTEAAKYLLTQAAWGDAVSNFVDSANAKRLSYQILHVYKARRYIEAFDSAAKLLAEPALAEAPRAFREGLATALFLSAVAEYRDTLVIAGRPLDRAWMVHRLHGATSPETIEAAVREVAALLETAVLRRIEAQAPTTGKMLREVQAVYQEAKRALERQREIIDVRNARDLMVLLKLALVLPADLAREAEATRALFHDAGVSPWREIWAATTPLTPSDHVLILIARTEVQKARLRTPEQWANEQIDAFRADAARHYNFLVHANAHRPMAWGRPTFADPVGFVSFVVVGGAAALHGLGWSLTGFGWLGPVLVALGLRGLGWVFAGRYLAHCLGGPTPVPFFTMAGHLRRRVEKLSVVVKGRRQSFADVRTFVENTNDEILRLTPPGQSPRILPNRRPVSLWIVAHLHWLLLVLALLAW